MPTKHLPQDPDLGHLKFQAKDVLKLQASQDRQAAQRIREFHPRFHSASDSTIFNAQLKLSDAQLIVAREYGFPSWARLKRHIEKPTLADNLKLPLHERIEDPLFRRAVELLDSGDVEDLRKHLTTYPGIVRQRVLFEGGNYFRNPTLLEFVAENPIRHDRLPFNIVDVAKLILEAGAKHEASSIDETLGLVSSGRVPREMRLQIPLIDLLCDYGANPDAAMPAALAHGEFEAVNALIRRGAKVDLIVEAATGRTDNARLLLQTSSTEQRHRALALAAQFGNAEMVRLLLEAGEEPSRYNPVGTHSHSTPLHQAALAGHEKVVRLLVENGARLDVKDTLFQGTPADWARYAGKTEIEQYLRTQGG